MESKKQTAVEWLQEAMSNKLSSEIGPYFLDLFEQAKAMEKDQIIEAYNTGELHCVTDPRTSLDYYQHHYGS